jgi:hypothetical protein
MIFLLYLLILIKVVLNYSEKYHLVFSLLSILEALHDSFNIWHKNCKKFISSFVAILNRTDSGNLSCFNQSVVMEIP